VSGAHSNLHRRTTPRCKERLFLASGVWCSLASRARQVGDDILVEHTQRRASPASCRHQASRRYSRLPRCLPPQFYAARDGRGFQALRAGQLGQPTQVVPSAAQSTDRTSLVLTASWPPSIVPSSIPHFRHRQGLTWLTTDFSLWCQLADYLRPCRRSINSVTNRLPSAPSATSLELRNSTPLRSVIECRRDTTVGSSR
jgi:hypothetical protein